MAMAAKLLRGGTTGLAVGAAVVVLGPVLLSALGRLAKPTAKTALEAGLMLHDRGRETAARMAEEAKAGAAATAAASTVMLPNGMDETQADQVAAEPDARVAEMSQPS